MANKLLINQVLEYLLFAVFPSFFFQSVLIYDVRGGVDSTPS